MACVLYVVYIEAPVLRMLEVRERELAYFESFIFALLTSPCVMYYMTELTRFLGIG